MVAQNDPDLLEGIQEYGCYFLSLARFKELDGKFEWGAIELNSIWTIAKACGAIDERSCIAQPNNICRLLGINLKYVDQHFAIDTVVGDEKYTIVRWELDGKSHFVVGYGSRIDFDPWPHSRTCRLGKPMSMRIYQRV
jgi:hypothetical protein